MVIVMIAIFFICSQSTSGSIKFIHVFETCVDSSSSVATLFFTLINPTGAAITEYIIRVAGTMGMFSFFTGITFFGLVYFLKFFRDTTYKYEKITRDG